MSLRSILPAVVAFSTAMVLPLTPYMANGAPFIGDSWVHIRYAEDIVESGNYRLDEYNRMWPLINLLLAFLRLVTGIQPTIISQFIPGLAGLSPLMIYLMLRRLRVSRVSRLIGILAFSYTPLYTSITFYSATMKETSTLYPLLALLYAFIFLSKPGKPYYVLNLMLSASVILGHHFGGLVALFCLLSGALQRFYEGLAINQRSQSIHLPVASLYALSYLAWNFLAISIVGLFFEVTVYDALYLISFFTLFSALTLKLASTPISILSPILTLTSLAGFRGLMYESITIQPPITVYEVAYYLLIGVLAAIGLRLDDGSAVISLSAAIASIYLACTLWDVGYTAIVLFTKSLHYLLIPIAIGLALFCEKIKRGRHYLAAALALILVLASTPGFSQAIKGLSSYSSDELLSLGNLRKILLHKSIYTDTRLRYPAKYFYDMEVTSIPFTGRLKGLLLLSKLNEVQGFLYGYERVQLSEVISDSALKEAERYYDSSTIFLVALR